MNNLVDEQRYKQEIQNALYLGKHTPRFKPVDPILFIETMWPNQRAYKKQYDIIESVEYCRETIVPSSNKGGKDWIASLIGLSYFLRHPEVRIIVTSVKDDHLRVFFGELMRHIQTCRFPLSVKQGGPLIINHNELKKDKSEGIRDHISYMRGMVSDDIAGLAGHHAKYTLAIIDEASGVDDKVYQAFQGWANRILILGNPNPCNNFFYNAVKTGDILK